MIRVFTVCKGERDLLTIEDNSFYFKNNNLAPLVTMDYNKFQLVYKGFNHHSQTIQKQLNGPGHEKT